MPVHDSIDSLVSTAPTLNELPARPIVEIDVATLLKTRLFIQANSGGGKSLLLRRLAEQLFGKTQILIIDPEGEFHTLREKYAFALAAPSGGDAVATPATAHVLARRFLELGVSAVIDINDLSPDDRLLFVTRFLSSMMTAPRALWRPCIVAIDEAQKFAPQDADDDLKRDCAAAVIDLAAQGRKRGFCAVIATQRISMLDKSVVAELNNFAIGRASLDLDIRRARSVIGMDQKTATATLPHLPAHTFFVVGPALAPSVIKIHTGHVETTHPREGELAAPPTPTPADVRKLLGDLGDLQSAAGTSDDPEVLKARIAELESKAAIRESWESPDSVESKAAVVRLTKRVRELEAENAVLTGVVEAMTKTIDDVQERFEQIDRKISNEIVDPLLELRNKYVSDLETKLEKDAADGAFIASLEEDTPDDVDPIGDDPWASRTHAIDARHREDVERDMGVSYEPSSDGLLPRMHRALLTVLAQRGPLPKWKALLFAGYAASGPVSRAWASLAKDGYIATDRGTVAITPAGRKRVGNVPPLPTGQALRERVRGNLPTMERKIFDVIADARGAPLQKKDILTRAGYAASGPVSQAFAYLVARDYVVRIGTGKLALAREML